MVERTNTLACGNDSLKYVGNHDNKVREVLVMHMWVKTMALWKKMGKTERWGWADNSNIVLDKH